MRSETSIKSALAGVLKKNRSLTAGLVVVIAGAIVTSLIPPLVLEKIVDSLTAKSAVTACLAMLYFASFAVSGLFDSGKEALITVFGQKVTHALRSVMLKKLEYLPADYYSKNDPGEVTSRFVNDVDTVEELFTSGIIGMFVDACKVAGILAVIFVKSPGLGIIMLAVTPAVYFFTRRVRRKMLSAQSQNRSAVARVTARIPETVNNLRMIHVFRREKYMTDRYDECIRESFDAVEKTNFYDAVYSPVILVINAAVIAVMMILAATGGAMQTLFGMSVGTAVAVIAYVGKVFGPIESIGMEIQSVQSAVAGVKRINEFLAEPERAAQDASAVPELGGENGAVVELKNVSFSYTPDEPVLEGLGFAVKRGETVTLTGCTGAGKSTVIKLILGLYSPQSGHVLVGGHDASDIPDEKKRGIFGLVEQSFRPVPGTILDQITLSDPEITREAAIGAARAVGLGECIDSLPKGIDEPYAPALFSQGQQQLLSIARAIAGGGKILLLDEMSANLDSATEKAVTDAIRRACEGRTVISVSHRTEGLSGGREIAIVSHRCKIAGTAES